MKTTIILFAFITLLTTAACAGEETITLGWSQADENVMLSDFAGWKIYTSDLPGGPYVLVGTVNYSGTILPEYTGDGVVTGSGVIQTKYFVVRAFNSVTGEESPDSNEVSKEMDFTNKFFAPVNLSIK